MDWFFFRFVTMHAFDRQTDRRTDGQTEFPSLYRDCIPCSAVIIIIIIRFVKRHNVKRLPWRYQTLDPSATTRTFHLYISPNFIGEVQKLLNDQLVSHGLFDFAYVWYRVWSHDMRSTTNGIFPTTSRASPIPTAAVSGRRHPCSYWSDVHGCPPLAIVRFRWLEASRL